ncbi:MAG: Mur ligase family protein [Methanobacteriaceae archaeon]
MIHNKKVLIVGAGNAGRPAANLFHYLGNDVIVSDSNIYENIPRKAKTKIDGLKDKGIVFELGFHNENLLDWADYVFISPNIPKNVDFIQKILEKSYKKLSKTSNENNCTCETGKLTLISTEDIGNILNSLIKIPMVGIAGTDGKTTTTNMINYSFSENLDTVIFSSLQNSLVIEGLIELVVDEKTNEKDLAIFELPHGTIRMAKGLELSAAVVTNLTPDHMDEFPSFEDYVIRNFAIKDLINNNGILILNGDDPIISNRLNEIKSNYILYGLNNSQKIDFEGESYFNPNVELDIYGKDLVLNGINGSSFTLVSKVIPTLICKRCNGIAGVNCSCGNFEPKYLDGFEKKVNISTPGACNIENTIATIAMALIFGYDINDIINHMAVFGGVAGRFEKIDKISFGYSGEYSNANIFMDAAHNPESMEKLFEGLEVDGNLIISLDNPDTLTTRDKTKIGQILGGIADIVICSAKNETTEVIDLNAPKEVLNACKLSANSKNRDIEIYSTLNVGSSIFKALNLASNGDTILHIGPGVVNAYDSVKNDIIEAINFYKDCSGEIVVVGGCGTVGSLMARVLNDYGFNVTVSDLDNNTSIAPTLDEEGIKLDLGSHSENVFKKASCFFLTPSLANNKTVLELIKNYSDNSDCSNFNSKSNFNGSAFIYNVNDIFKYFDVHKNVFAVTGTNGKTTTVHMLKSIFKKANLSFPEHKLAIQGNTELIPPLQARLNGDVAIVEIGTFGNKGEIKSSSELCSVETAVITNISHDHLENSEKNKKHSVNINSFYEYVNCKKEIIDIAPNLVLNADDPIVAEFSTLKTRENLIFFGMDFEDEYFNISNDNKDNINSTNINKNTNINKPSRNIINNALESEKRFCPNCNSELTYKKISLGHLGQFNCKCGFKNIKPNVKASKFNFSSDMGKTSFTLSIDDHKETIYVTGGMANIYNALSSAATAFNMGIDFKHIVNGLNDFEGVEGRFEIINTNPTIILDFAHNPAGVKSVLESAKNLTNSKSSLIVLNTIDSESGDDGNIEIAKLLSDVDVIIPVSNAAHKFRNYILENTMDINNFNNTNNINNDIDGENVYSSNIIELEGNKTNNKWDKVGTIGSSAEQVKEALEIALKLAITSSNNSNNSNSNTNNIGFNKFNSNNFNNSNEDINNISLDNPNLNSNFNNYNADTNNTNNDNVILVIGEGGIKYTKKIIKEMGI